MNFGNENAAPNAGRILRMRVLATILTLTILTELKSQDIEFMQHGDSLTIRAENIIRNPFGFGSNPLAYLKKFSPKQKIKLIQNEHVEGKIDTVFSLIIETNQFVVYKVDSATNFLLDAEILTERFKSLRGIKIGMTKKAIIKLLDYSGVSTIPKFLVFENLETPTHLTVSSPKSRSIQN